MNYIQTEIEGTWITEPKVFNGARGYFMEAFKEGELCANIGNVHLVQDNEPKSSFDVLCELHYQKDEYSQAELVRVIKGKVLDVVVDLCQSSPTLGKYVSVELSEGNKRQFFIPRGFVHGFLALSEGTIFIYKVDNGYAPRVETSIRFNDETVGIDWPVAEPQPLLSEKDGHAVSLKNAEYFEQDTKVATVGTRHVGLVIGICFAEIGVNVICVDTNSGKIEALNQGIIPIYENELEDIVHRNTKAGCLQFITLLENCLDEADVIFSVVGTPLDEDDNISLGYVLKVARTIGRNMKKYALAVTKSTVSVGTAKKVCIAIQEELDKRRIQIEFDVASNPELLKEGNVAADFTSPDRVVVGVESECTKELMSKLYKPLLLNNFRVTFMDILSVEMTKYAANSMLAIRISFMSDIANLCELVRTDVNMARSGIGSDTRAGRKSFYPGIGYGGSCLPKDVKAPIKTAEQNGYQMCVLQVVEEVNKQQKSILFEELQQHSCSDLHNKTVVLWGLAFEPETDDMRETPSLILINKLPNIGCKVCVYDPAVMKERCHRIGDSVCYATNTYDAALDVDVLMLVTERKEFRLPSWAVIRRAMRIPALLDGRNIYEKKEIEGPGSTYHCIGK